MKDGQADAMGEFITEFLYEMIKKRLLLNSVCNRDYQKCSNYINIVLETENNY